MKKLLACLIVSIFFFNNIAFWAYWEENMSDTSKYSISASMLKKKLSTSSKWKKYIKIVDKFIEKYGDDKEKIEEILKKISPLIEEWKISDSETLYIIKYINYSCLISLASITQLNEDENLNDILSETITESDKKIIEDKIMLLQSNALEKWKNLMNNITKEFDHQTNYEEKWNLDIDLNVDYEQLWKISWYLKLNDYTSSASWFDSQIKWELEAFLNAIPKWEDEIKLKLNSLIDVISKDWNLYVLLEKLNISDEKWVEEIKDTLDKIKNIAENNQYIKISDEQSQNTQQILKFLNPNNIINDYWKILSKPLVSAYKKEGNKYFLKPTKFACDSFKEIANKFDPLNPTTCSDKQYEDLLKSFVKTWEFYAEILDNNVTKIWFNWNINESELIKNQWYITFNDSNILELSYNTDSQTQWSLNLEYIHNSKLDFVYKNSDSEISFIWKLNNNNKYSNFVFNLSSSIWYNNISSNISLKDNVIDGWFVINDNYSKKIITWNIKWETDKNDKISTLLVNYIWKDDKQEYLSWKIAFWNSNFIFSNDYVSEYSKSNVLISLNLDENNIPTNWDIKMNFYNKLWSFDYETYEYKYDSDYSKSFDLDINIDNKKISWKSNIYSNWELLLNILHSWSFDLKKFESYNSYNFSDNFSKNLNLEEWELVSWKFNISSNTSENNNNANILLNVLFGNKEIFNFSIENISTREYKSINITTPSNYIEMKDIENKISY